MRYGSDPVRQALYPWLQDFWVFFRLDLLGLVLQIVIVGTRLLRPPSSSLALFTAFPMFILLRVGQQTAIWYSVRNEYPRGALTCAVLRLVLPASFAGYITYALRAYPLRYDDLGPSLAAVLEKRDRQQAVLMYVGCWVAFAFEVALGYKAAMLVHAGVFGHGLEGSSVCRPVLPGDVTAELDPAWLKSAQTVLDGLEMKMSFRRVCSNKTHRSNTAGHHLAYHHQQHAVRTLKRQQVGQILKTSVKIGATPSWGGAHDLVPPPRHQFQRRFVQASYELGTLRWTLRHYTWIDALIDVCIVHKYLLVLCNEHDGTLEIWLQPPDDATMRSFQQGLLALTKCWPHPLTTERQLHWIRNVFLAADPDRNGTIEGHDIPLLLSAANVSVPVSANTASEVVSHFTYPQIQQRLLEFLEKASPVIIQLFEKYSSKSYQDAAAERAVTSEDWDRFYAMEQGGLWAGQAERLDSDLTLLQFYESLLSDANSAVAPPPERPPGYLSHPIAHYFISCSHNSMRAPHLPIS